jgi:predicted RecA/RadA family phage recombinase
MVLPGAALDYLSSNTELILSPSADHTATGIFVTLTAGEDLLRGSVVYMKSDGKAWKADANGTGTYPCVALAMEGISADATGKFLLKGIFRDDSYAAPIASGTPLYLSASAGNITATAPTTTDYVVQVVGIALTGDIIYFNPSFNYITHV